MLDSPVFCRDTETDSEIQCHHEMRARDKKQEMDNSST